MFQKFCDHIFQECAESLTNTEYLPTVFQFNGAEKRLEFVYNFTMTERKLAIISDFHLDANQFNAQDLDIFDQVLQGESITDLHFAGDISNDLHKLSLPLLDNFAAKYNVTYNLGNHDMLGLDESEIRQTDFLVKSFGSKTFLAFHGWYDYSFYQGDTAKILHFKNNFYFDRKIKRQLDDPATTDQILDQLNQTLSALPAENEVIIAMHFVPERHFIFPASFKKFSRFNAFLGSQRFHELFRQYPNVTDVVFGHVHHRFSRTQIDGINYHARPLGYTYDWELLSDFLAQSPEKAGADELRMKKRYLSIKNSPEWAEFRSKNLAREFRSALTILEG